MTQARYLSITLLTDNLAAPGLRPEHGFSAWIDIAGRRFLFDTGQGAAMVENAKSLGIDLGTAEAIVLSHGHYDHTGGVPLAVAQAANAKIYVHPASTTQRYSIRGGLAKPIDMPERTRIALREHSSVIEWTTQPKRLTPEAGLTGPIPRITDYEDTGGPFFTDEAGLLADPIEDDLAFWIRTNRGLVVVVGCSHSGVVNTVRHALSLAGESRLNALLGGFHLNEASERRLERTMAELGQLEPELIMPCHCTGNLAVERLRDSFGCKVQKGFAGVVLHFAEAV